MYYCGYFVALMITAGASLVASQSLNLTEDSTNTIICAEEVVIFTCTADNTVISRIQWIAEPFIAADDNRRLIENIPNNLGTRIPIGPMVIQYVFENPFITQLVIDANLVTNSTNITCSTVGPAAEGNTLQYMASQAELVKPVTNLNVTPMAADFDTGAMLVSFEKSPSPDIVYYKINCTRNTCQEVMIDARETTVTILANSDIDGVSHTVCACAINRCGRESDMVTVVMPLKTIEVYSASVIIWPIAVVGFVAITAVFIIFIVYYKACKDREGCCECCNRYCCIYCHKRRQETDTKFSNDDGVRETGFSESDSKSPK